MTITLHFGWPLLLPVAALSWLSLVVPIGNLLQREWWFGVLLISMAAVPVCFLAAVVSIFI
jgi:hypothetical protein